ncbi:hypothetical protein CDL15_Pgr015967 [Punica granatum]|uniref:Bifunctional lysine-specific demethylase and histidyl-hydroxylase n=1 Tax=Punica granatum TaxID=22663 RepID=A0A218XQZ3_PUNGR|nr:hypothetical protein CDL15_Pgr015967 [Punica granatum]
MEEETPRRRRRSSKAHERKRRRAPSESIPSIALELAGSDTLFCLLLSALSKAQDSPNSSCRHLSLIKKCLRKLRQALLRESEAPVSPRSLPVPILSLLPVIVKSKFWDIACLGLEVVGAAALRSLETNEQIALDSDILSCVIWGLRSPCRKLKSAACGAMLDLSSSSVGRERLLECSALETLMDCFLQVPKCSWGSLTLCTGDDGSANRHMIACKEEEFPVILLDAIIILVNSCSNEQLENISLQSSESFSVLLKGLWTDLNSQILVNSVFESNQTGDFYPANSRVNDLAESIFRLSIDGQCANFVPSEDIRKRIFGSDEVSFENFMLNHWERSPRLINKIQRTVDEEDSFWSFLQHLNCKSSLPQFLTSMLQNMVSCPPIASDELDILNFLKQEKDKLAMPITYQQDIRVLKTERHLNREAHFFSDSWGSRSKKPYIFNCDDIAKCEEALEKGYTVAIRGMEFRFKSVAAITKGLASLFGQPSVGANLYLTPPNSQGLARHYDDHCVFVCQLIGTKQWTISPPQGNLLPRLYEPISGTCLSEASNGMDGCMQIMLKEGDILYVPRGFFHEAYTTNGGFSLHLTLAVEVEAPFEWEGFMHVALRCWSWKNLKQVVPEEHPTGSLDFISVKLLHIMIGLLGNSDPTFRKACLVGSISWSSFMSNWLGQSQRTIFSNLIEKINSESKFMEVLMALETAVRGNEDPFRRLRWLQILDQEGGTLKGHDGQIFDFAAEDLVSLCCKDRQKAEAAFMNVKSGFCKEMTLEQGSSSYRLVLEKYKKVRKQYLNGMLSLHCKLK